MVLCLSYLISNRNVRKIAHLTIIKHQKLLQKLKYGPVNRQFAIIKQNWFEYKKKTRKSMVSDNDIRGRKKFLGKEDWKRII